MIRHSRIPGREDGDNISESESPAIPNNDQTIKNSEYMNVDEPTVYIGDDNDDYMDDDEDEHTFNPFQCENTQSEGMAEHSILITETIDTANINVEVETIKLHVLQPFHEVIKVMVDTGYSLDAIGPTIAFKYKQHLRTMKRPRYIHTASEKIAIKQYLPLIIHDDVNDRNIKTKMYVLMGLPHDYIIGRSTIKALGKVQVFQNHDEYFSHKPEVLDRCDYEDYSCASYPIEGSGPKIDFDSIKIENEEIREDFISLLKDYEAVFANSEMDIGEIKGVEFKIEFKDGIDTSPVACKEYPHPRTHVKEIQRQLDGLLEAGMISHSISPWKCPTFIVPKKTGDARIVFDYRKLNAMTKRNEYPLPRTDELIERFRGKKIITSLDIKSGYHHIKVRDGDQEKLAFSFAGRMYEWNVMPFGPTNAPACFQAAMHKLFDGLDFMIIYMDDLTIVSDTIEEHLEHLQIVFDIMKEYRINLRIDKCAFAVKNTEYLGFVVNKEGYRVTSRYQDKIHNCPTPRNRKELQRFVGLANYIHKFIPLMYEYLLVLRKLLKAKTKWYWGQEQEDAFNALKDTIMHTPFLKHPDGSK